MDYFNENLEGSNQRVKLSSNQKEYEENQNLYKEKVEELFVCPNCDSEYNSDIWCSCWYWVDNKKIEDIYLKEKEEKIVNERQKYQEIAEKNKWNWEKLKLVKDLENIFFYDYHWRIWNWKAIVEIQALIENKNTNIKKYKYKKRKIKFYFTYKVDKNKIFRWESEWKSITSHILEKIEVLKDWKWEDRGLYSNKIKDFLNTKIYHWKNIENLIVQNILGDYRYNQDLCLD